MSKKSLKKIENCGYLCCSKGTRHVGSGTVAAATVPNCFDFLFLIFAHDLRPQITKNMERNWPDQRLFRGSVSV